MTTPSKVLDELEDKLAALDLPNTLSELDRLTPVYTLEDFLASEMDRRFLILPTLGPSRATSRSRCADQITFSLRVRYFSDRESRNRMIDDVPAIREALKSSCGITDMVGTPSVSAPAYDYGQWPGANAIGVRVDVVIEYHVGDAP